MDSEIQKLLDRGTVDVIVREELESKLKSGKKLKIKLGIDPTGADLHLGHMVVIKKLREFQQAGHNIQFLFGNFTGQIGDPTDKLDSRPIKTQNELEKNAAKYLEQVGIILDTKNVDVFWNAEWLSALTFADVIKLAQCFTVHQMLERDMYEERIKKELPIYIHEFLYPLMQGYDSVALKSDLELGGTDQTFNLLAGRTIQKSYGIEAQNVLTVPILVGTDGKEKMGKSLNNYIGVTESAKEMFGKTMSIPDDVIIDYFILTTDLELKKIDEYKKALKSGENPRNVKIALAKEIITLYHSKEAASQAEKEFEKIFVNKGLPDQIELANLSKNKWGVLDLFTETNLCSSKGEVRRLIQNGGIKVDGEKISNIDEEIDIKEETLLQVGKRKFLKVISK
ncbi:tyrosine--tRNA ligase [Candidatus Peregrinibacteria bacterium]|nr:tyrosine--tRNA ligase [Candidatus Peregrinibacteria bacterium]